MCLRNEVGRVQNDEMTETCGVALIYVRRSMVRYEADRASPEQQLGNCVRVCEEKRWSYELYQDAEGHRSGRSEKHRPDRARADRHTQV